MATISGKVEDASGNGTTGVVRAYRALSGALVGEASANATTGLYSITTNYAGEPHFVVRHVAAVVDKDTLFANCILGAQLFGVNGGTFFPETYSATYWTAVGTPTTSTTTSPFSGKSSLSLNGSSQLNYTPTTRQNVLANGNNFSVECRFRRGNTSAGSLVGHNHLSSFNSYAGWSLHVDASGHVIARLKDTSGGAEKLITSTSVIDVDAWTHVEFSLISNVGYLFINGYLEATMGSIINTSWGVITEPIRIGYTQMYGYFTGDISDVRVSNVGRHSSTFTVPSTPNHTYLTYETPTGNAQVFDYVIPV